MKVADSFLSLKLETLQILMAVQDPAKLQRVRAVLEESEPTPQHLLDLIQAPGQVFRSAFASWLLFFNNS